MSAYTFQQLLIGVVFLIAATCELRVGRLKRRDVHLVPHRCVRHCVSAQLLQSLKST